MLGAIDIGTNTTRLMIAQFGKDGKLESLRREARITRLGEGVNETSSLKETAIQRTFGAIAEYKNMLDSAKVADVVVAATSAVRDAKNSQVFLSKVGQLIGTEVRILSGQREAKLSFFGATYDLDDLSASPQYAVSSGVVVLDVGGGSTEITVGRPPDQAKAFSLDIGSVRLTEIFLKDDPPSAAQIEATKNYIRVVLAPAISQIRDSDFWPKTSDVESTNAVLLGVAGTITTIAAVKQGMEIYDLNKIHHFKLSYSDICKTLETFLSVPLVERKEIIGLEPKRADVIIAGALIVLHVLEGLNLREIIVSEHDILDGLILSLAQFKQ